MAAKKRRSKSKPVKPEIHDALLATGHTSTRGKTGKTASCAATLLTGTSLMEKAFQHLETAEVAIRESRTLINVAGKRQNVPALKYLSAMRAINTIAARPCEVGPWSQGHKTCNEAITAGDTGKNERCWPCYAWHVKDGGAP